jgi:hypothetical protein
MRLNELNTEINSWLQALEVMQRENAEMKTRLADVVKQAMSASALEDAELFQNRFLNKDTVISFLRADIKKQAQKIDDSMNPIDVQKLQNKLRVDMKKMENEFHNMRSVFASYLSQFSKAS